MSISVLSITSTRSRLLDAVGQRLAVAIEIGRRGQRHLRRAAQPRQRRAQIVRHVVERAAHRRSTSPSILSSMALNSDVSSSIASSCRADRHARVGAPGADDPPDGLRQPADRLQRRLRRQPAAGQRDDDDRQRDEAERGAEPRQQVLARFGALPDLHERAVRQLQPTRSRASTDPSLRGLLRTTASTPRSTTRTNSRSGAVCCSARTVSASARMPPRLIRGGVVAELAAG